MATVIDSQTVGYNTYRWLSPLIFKLIDEVGAENIEILQDVVLDRFLINFEVQGHSYSVAVNHDLRLGPLDFEDSSFQSLIVEIKLRHF